MCLKGFPSLEVSTDFRVGFVEVGFQESRKIYSASPAVAASRSRQQKDDKSKPRKQEGNDWRHYRTEVGPA
jgi:hypothetical protein